MIVKVANIVQNLVYSLIFGHFGKLAMIALYFILTQLLHGQHLSSTAVLPNEKYAWDHLFSANIQHGGLIKWMTVSQWNDVRHQVRPFMEGLMAALLFWQVGINARKYMDKRPLLPGKIDRFLIHVPLVPSRYKKITAVHELSAVFLVAIIGIVIAIPMFVWVLPWLHSLLQLPAVQASLSKHPTLAEKLYAGGSADAFIVAFIAVFLCKRIVRPVLAANMIFFAHWWLGHGYKVHNWMPSGMRDTICWLDQNKNATEQREEVVAASGSAFSRFIVVLSVLMVMLAGAGFYIINWIA